MDKRKSLPDDDCDSADQSNSSEIVHKKSKHTLDSDEEDDEEVSSKYNVMDPAGIEGEEDGDVRSENQIQITPFNMKEELEEGHFDREGMYIPDKEEEEVKDHWLDNIDWVKVEERPILVAKPVDKDEEPADSSQPFDVKECYRSIICLLQPGESVQKAIIRLGQRSRSTGKKNGRKGKASAIGSHDDDDVGDVEKDKMLLLISLADQLISNGDMDAYELTYEQLRFRLNTDHSSKCVDKIAEERDSDGMEEKVKVVGVRKTDAAEAATTTTTFAARTTDSDPLICDVKWYLRWSDTDDAQVHGPFSNDQMIQWRDAGYFSGDAFVRQDGKAQAVFHSAKRIDFDLYS